MCSVESLWEDDSERRVIAKAKPSIPFNAIMRKGCPIKKVYSTSI
jgi:hypothetical protein